LSCLKTRVNALRFGVKPAAAREVGEAVALVANFATDDATRSLALRRRRSCRSGALNDGAMCTGCPIQRAASVQGEATR